MQSRHIPAQIACLIVAFFLVLFVGEMLSIRYSQTRFLTEDILGGRPLPAATQFFMENRYSIAHLSIIPWLCLVAWPLFNKKEYFDWGAFIARYIVFATVQVLWFVLLLFFLILPFLPYYAVLEGFEPTQFDTTVRISFWLLCTIAIVGIARRIYLLRKQHNKK